MGTSGTSTGGSFKYGYSQRNCQTKYNVKIEQECRQEYDTVVETTYVEQCRDFVSQHCSPCQGPPLVREERGRARIWTRRILSPSSLSAEGGKEVREGAPARVPPGGQARLCCRGGEGALQGVRLLPRLQVPVLSR